MWARRCRPVLLVAALVLVGCGGGTDDPAESGDRPPATATTPVTAPESTGPVGTGPPGPPSPTPPSDDPPSTSPGSPSPAPPASRFVVAISVDGLSPQALRELGPAGAPAIWSLIDAGAATLNARTEVERTVTLPNHVGMVTGRPIDPAVGGHGVTWNEEIPGRTVQSAAGTDVRSIFTAVHESGGTTAVFAGKGKFRLFASSWPEAVDTTVITGSTTRLGAQVAQDLRRGPRTFTFVHLAAPDQAGHTRGWMSPAYLDAVGEADAAVGDIIDVVAGSPALARSVSIVLTADHGGEGRGHSDAADPDDYTIPFVVSGPTVPHGDLYALSPGLADPGSARPSYVGPQPVRNCDLADVSAALLGLAPVRGSSCEGASAMPLVAR